MSHQVHIPAPHIQGQRYPKYKPSPDTGEARSLGHVLGCFLRWSIFTTARCGATVLDLLRMRQAKEGYLEWKKLFLIWLGYFSYLALAFGLIAAFNGLFAEQRWELLEHIPGFSKGAKPLNLMLSQRFGSITVHEICSVIDYASVLIPLLFTIRATAKYFRLSKAQSYVGESDSECHYTPWNWTQKCGLAFGVVTLVLGMPGAPAGLWVLLSLIGWIISGTTKNAGKNTLIPQPVTTAL